MTLLSPDEDTLYLFDLTQTNTGSQVLVLDSIGNNNLILTGTAYFVTGPGGSSIRAMESSTMKKFGVTDDFLTASRGDYTIEGWLYPNEGHSAQTFWQGPNGSGESLVTNFTGRWILGTDNLWDYISEFGSGGTNVVADQTTGALDNDTWNYVALRRYGSGSFVVVDYWKNGNLVETVSASGELPGDTAGTDLPDQEISFDGLVKSIRFSNVTRSNNEIISHWSSSQDTMQLSTDDDTVALWQMNEEPLFPNRGIAPHHLAVDAGTFKPAIPLVKDTNNSLLFESANCNTTITFASGVAAEINNNDITVDFWFRTLDNEPQQNFCNWAGDAGSDEGFKNHLFRVRLETSRRFAIFLENGEGDDIIGNPTTYITTRSLTESDVYNKHHLALVRRIDEPNNQIYLDYYFDGQLWETSSGSATISPPSGGEKGRMWVCGGPTQTDTLNMQQFRLTKRALSASEIFETYETGISSSGIPSEQIINVFRGVNLFGSFVYFRSDEERPAGLSDITVVNTFTE